MVTNETIAATLAADTEPESAAKTLLALANDGGGSDNITLLIARFNAPDAAGRRSGEAVR